jgi:hypothetical protein
MDFRARTDIANLSFYENGRMNGLEGDNSLLRLANILLFRQRGKIDDDRIEASFCRFLGLGKGVRMIRVQKD